MMEKSEGLPYSCILFFSLARYDQNWYQIPTADEVRFWFEQVFTRAIILSTPSSHADHDPKSSSTAFWPVTWTVRGITVAYIFYALCLQ